MRRKQNRNQMLGIAAAVLVVLIGLALIFGDSLGLTGTGADDAGGGDDSAAAPADDGGAAPPADTGGDGSAPPADAGGGDDSSAPPADGGGDTTQTGGDTTTGQDTTGEAAPIDCELEVNALHPFCNQPAAPSGDGGGGDTTQTGGDTTGQDTTQQSAENNDALEAAQAAQAAQEAQQAAAGGDTTGSDTSTGGDTTGTNTTESGGGDGGSAPELVDQAPEGSVQTSFFINEVDGTVTRLLVGPDGKEYVVVEPLGGGDNTTEAAAEATAEATEAAAEVAAVAPAASFGIEDLGNGTFRFFNNDFTGGIATFTWDLGDGNSTAGAEVTHTYAQSGSYTVTLSITSADGFAPPVPPTQSQTVTVTVAPATLSIEASANATGLAVSFSASATSSAGQIVSWSWKLADGTEIGTAQSFNYTFAAGGTYSFTVTATDDKGNTVASPAQQITVAPATLPTSCEPSFTPDPTNPLAFTFNVTGQNIASYSWFFSDTSETVAGAQVNHTYTTPGNYTFTVTCTPVANGAALEPITGSVTVQASAQPVTLLAQFGASPLSGPPDTRFVFTNQSTVGTGITYSWLVVAPDGSSNTYTSTNLDLAFAQEGNYAITLTVSDGTRSVTAEGQVSVVVGAEKPLPDFTLTDLGNLTIEFADASTGGPVDTYRWEVRDEAGAVLATFNGAGPFSYTFARAMKYTVYLSVEGPGGGGVAWKQREMVSGGTVTADFEIVRVSDLVDGQAEVCFSNTSRNAQENYWVFDVLGNAEEIRDDAAQVCHVYTSAQAFGVRLRTVGQNGDATAEKAREVVVVSGGTPPVARFNLSSTNTTINKNITFTNQSSDAQTWLWEIYDQAGTKIAENASNWNWGYTFTSAGTYEVRLIARNEFGDSEAASNTITITSSEVACSLGDIAASVYPSQAVTYRANVTNLLGRTYTTRTWTVTNTADNSVLASADNAGEIAVTWAQDGTYKVRFEATLSDGTTCNAERDVTVATRAMTCSLVGNFSFIPTQPTTIQVNVNEEWRGKATFEWTVNGVVSDNTSNSLTISDVQGGTSYAISAVARATDAAGTAVQATCNLGTIPPVGYPGLVCRNPKGGTSPLVNETITYTPTVDNVYGRTLTYNWELYEGTTLVTQGTDASFVYPFAAKDAGKTYTLTYWASTSTGGENSCAKRSVTIRVNANSYACSFPGESGGYNDSTPSRETTNFKYRFNVKGGTGVLTYNWTVTGIGGQVQTFSTTVNEISVLGSVFQGTWSDSSRASVAVSVSSPEGPLNNCQGTLSIRPGDWRTINFTSDKPSVQTGEQFCLTNASEGTWFPVGDAVTYSWVMGENPGGVAVGTDLGSDNKLCLTYNQAGNYRIKLVARTAYGLTRETTKTITVAARQSISATATPNAVNGTALVTFNAVGTNIDQNSYVWTSPIDGSTKRGQSVSFRLPAVTEPTDYTFTVVGQGPLGQSNASVVVRAGPAGSEIRAAFVPDRYGIRPGEELCFTDQSSSSAVTWLWDFGDGSDTVSYTTANYQDKVCHTFADATPGATFGVRLTVTNANSIPAAATNTIRVLTELESASSFEVTPQGEGRVCYTARTSDGVLVSGWDFNGDGQLDETFEGDLNAPCFVYDQEGSYLVTMFIRQGNNTGSVPQRVVVSAGTSTARPALTVVGECSVERNQNKAVFTVRNGGGDMLSAENVVITDAAGKQLTAEEGNDLQLTAGGSKTFTVRGVQGVLTFSVTHLGETVQTQTTCQEQWDRSSVSVTGVCRSSTAVFTVTNTGDTDMAGPTNWRLYELLPGNTVGKLYTSGQLTLTGNGTLELSFTPDQLGIPADQIMNIRLVVDQRPGHPGFSEPRADLSCAAPPPPPVKICLVTDNSYTVTDVAPADLQSTITANPGSFEITSQADLERCAPPPVKICLVSNGTYSVTEVKADQVQNLITNNPGSFQIMNAGDEENCAPVVKICLVKDNTYTVTDIPERDLDDTLTNNPGSFQIMAAGDEERCAPPEPVTVCLVKDNTFTITNIPEDDLDDTLTNNPGSFQIMTAGDEERCVPPVKVCLVSNGTYTVTDLPAADLADTLTNNPGSFQIMNAGDEERCVPPVKVCLVSNGTYTVTDLPAADLADTLTNNPGSFQIMNAGDEENCVAPVKVCLVSNGTYTVTDLPAADLADTLTNNPGSFQIMTAGDEERCVPPVKVCLVSNGTYTVTDLPAADLADTLTNNPGSFQIMTAGDEERCVPPVKVCLVSNGTYTVTDLPAADLDSTLTNNPGSFQIMTAGDEENCVAPVKVCLVSNGTYTVTDLPAADLDDTLTNNPGSFQIMTAGDEENCVAPAATSDGGGGAGDDGSTEPPVEVAEAEQCGRVMPALDPHGLPIIDLNNAFCGEDAERGNPDWQPVGQYAGLAPVCPDWLAYHTNQTGDWEIFALGEIPNRAADLGNNLSVGVGSTVFDFFPARSPDAQWLAFASNRDGNFEIYVTNVETGFTQRATVNDQSIDVDPVWSLDQQWLAYESNVNGSWDVRLLNLATGQSFPLTDHPGNDLNPFFSPDGKKIVFQSDRTDDGVDNYKLYEIDLSQLDPNTVPEPTQITFGDGNDLDPQYSNDGTQIAFRSVGRDPANTRSVIFVINADGSGLQQISDGAGDATNHAWSPQDNLIAYQSNVMSATPTIFDIFTYDFRDGQTRLVTYNEGDDYAPVSDTSPTWFCDSESEVIFTSIQTGDNNIYSAASTPVEPIKVDEGASQMTTDPNNDRDPQDSPLEENASRGGSLPPTYTGSN